MLCCPVCELPLKKQERILKCESGHCFDVSSQGYVNLLIANKKSSQNPGDNAAMILGRTRFLDSGCYEPLSDMLNKTISEVCSESQKIVDMGCGEGYYSYRLYEYLESLGKKPELIGADLSRAAVKHAATRCKSAQFIVASLFELPISESCADICYNIFSPLCPTEFARVLKPMGHFIAVYPAERHLFGMKEILYDAPYENADKSFELDGFKIDEKKRLTYSITVKGHELIESLFSMTPYYYKTPREGVLRLKKADNLSTEADFWIVTYSRT